MTTSRITMLLTKFTVVTTLLSAPFAGAQAGSITAEALATNCQELIAIYDKKGEQRFIAGMSTSVAEAMRAGICRGMIEEHANHNSCYRNWYDIASTIAELDTYSNVERMLDHACVK